ncbi:alcohol dehydrogenase GroES domain protein [Collybia nuda]|uniref:Alcohol dehydrogenase GroES domain protein n=1 Tax=Collybia nuda TaxID=64659 RepID=A0A9P5Y301_9AGAR|nr:alcohol dehydrogenase GroES domain protein [Collybia nuda]
MKAARSYGPGDIRVEQIEEPVAGEGQVKVKIAWNGICGSDVHAFLTTVPKYLQGTTPDPLSGESLPVTLGHEFSGTIVSVGPGVDGQKWTVGQNIVVEPMISCMKSACPACSIGSRNLCPLNNFIGVGGWGGGLAEYIAVYTQYIHPLPNNVPLDVGACVEPLAVAWHAVKRSGFTKGQSALVLGAGPIGLFLLKVLQSFDRTALIIVSEPTVLRRQSATKQGATHVIDPKGSNVSERVMELTAGIGVDVAFDAAGVQVSIDAAIESVKIRGTVVNLASWEKLPVIDIHQLLLKEIYLTGTAAYDRVHPELLEALEAGKITGIEQLITRRVALEDVVEKGFLALLNDKDNQVKILIHP